jgi:putative redox protein
MPVTRAHLDLLTVEGDGLRFEARNERGQTIVLDSGARATSLDPMQALAAALGACTGMDVISILRKKRQAVTAYAIDVAGQRREEHPRAYTAIEVVHRLRGKGLDPKAVEEALRLSETRYCSVSASLVAGVAITNRFELAEDGP